MLATKDSRAFQCTSYTLPSRKTLEQGEISTICDVTHFIIGISWKKTTADHAVWRPWAPRPLWTAWDVRRGQGWRGTKVSSWSRVYLVVGRVDGMKPEGNGGLTEFTKINGSIPIVSRSSIHISYPWSRTLSNLSCSGKIGCGCGQISMAPKKQKISWHPFWGVNLYERNRGLSECTNNVRSVALIWLYKEAFFECGRKEMT